MKEKEEQPSGFFAKLRSYLPGSWGNWKVPAIAGVIAGIMISGPIGIGVAAGIYFSSRIKDSGIAGQGKNALLMGTSVGITAASTATGAAIGSAIFPIVGTFIGGVAGLIGGLIASKIATEVIKRKYMSPKISASQATPEAHQKSSVQKKERGSSLSPEKTPSKVEEKGMNLRK